MNEKQWLVFAIMFTLASLGFLYSAFQMLNIDTYVFFGLLIIGSVLGTLATCFLFCSSLEKR